MKLKILFFLLGTSAALMAQPAPSTPSGPSTPANFAMPSGPLPPPDESATASATATDSSVVPSANFAPDRYETLWKKSPFAVETVIASVDTSPDYMLVGLANVEGISYASLVERQNQEHFLISTDRATRGLTLGKITRSQDGSDTYASVTKDGQTLTLKLEQAAGGAPEGMPNAPPGMPMMNAPRGMITPNIPMPGSNNVGGPGSMRPFPRVHRPTIHLPSQQQPPPAPAPPP